MPHRLGGNETLIRLRPIVRQKRSEPQASRSHYRGLQPLCTGGSRAAHIYVPHTGKLPRAPRLGTAWSQIVASLLSVFLGLRQAQSNGMLVRERSQR